MCVCVCVCVCAQRDRKERSELKRFVLDYEQRQEEEAYTGEHDVL